MQDLTEGVASDAEAEVFRLCERMRGGSAFVPETHLIKRPITMEPIVHQLTELCRDLTVSQFRLAIPPLMVRLPAHPHIGSPERAADCIVAVFSRLQLNHPTIGIRLTRYERLLAESLWSWNRDGGALSEQEKVMTLEMSEAELNRLQAWFERVRTLFDGSALFYGAIRQQ